MGLFTKKKKKEDTMPDFSRGQSSVPIDNVAAMMQQGYTNEQIVQTLQSQGFSVPQIYDAINQASMRPMQPMDYGMQAPQPQQPQYNYPQQNVQAQQPQIDHIDEEKIQEVAEAVIEEKWEGLTKDIKAVIEWKNRSEGKMVQLEQEISDLKSSLDSLNSSIIGKVGQYDKNLMEVGTEIKAMEKEFQNILPSLTENVAKLERIAKGASAPSSKSSVKK